MFDEPSYENVHDSRESGLLFTDLKDEGEEQLMRRENINGR